MYSFTVPISYCFCSYFLLFFSLDTTQFLPKLFVLFQFKKKVFSFQFNSIYLCFFIVLLIWFVGRTFHHFCWDKPYFQMWFDGLIFCGTVGHMPHLSVGPVCVFISEVSTIFYYVLMRSIRSQLSLNSLIDVFPYTLSLSFYCTYCINRSIVSCACLDKLYSLYILYCTVQWKPVTDPIGFKYFTL